MHSFVREKTTFIHHGDYEGDVEIIDRSSGTRVLVEMDDLRDFFANAIRSKAINALEQMPSKDLLALLPAMRPTK